MLIDWESFSPWISLAGGIMIGIAASIYALLNGRILGVSGIVSGLLFLRSGEISWRISFIAGLALSALCFTLFGNINMFDAPQIDADITLLIIAGLLVGFGSRLGSGCTSGHGVCGISRLSIRSIIATILFMLAGFITVYLLRHVFI